LVWDRFVASQMPSAVFLQTNVEIKADDALFIAVGTVPVFQGFMALYVEGEYNQENGNGEKKLPSLSEGEILELLNLTSKQHFTQPPYRFSEATLIKELEEKGIGRPSTYATILATIKEKEYVRLEKGKFFPTELGCMVNDLLVVNFPDIFDIEFTAQMEENLDKIEEGKRDWVDTLKEFYRVLNPGGKIVLANLRAGVSPLAISIRVMVDNVRAEGLRTTARRMAALMPDMIKMAYYNWNLRRESQHHRFGLEEQKVLLEDVGFGRVSETKLVYSGQGILNSAYKLANA
jgi:SAM-dependent methyltransferase